ncbi:copper amine oxidase N-terminal domain-containing protein [Paenibacillus paeoniae]|uniref:Copper amine oxidase N-terminal domain-containing protein n=1 Tax=Paenibacillus paeoniae TaxID=2292705 RepID=A0A371PL16_9BACL|nr:copper amine oxidase N-terminal domain-containing protein [Paenibacillus paeoniae]REK76886.1 copper amine oxidase N-terminal domain-containing protein [Paenibacillus paeoniae]
MFSTDRFTLTLVAKSVTRLLLAATIAYGTITVADVVPAHASETASITLTNNKQAIEHAKSLNVLPEGTIVTKAEKRHSGEWEIFYTTDEKDKNVRNHHLGEIWLSAENGEVLFYKASMSSDTVSSDKGEQQVSFEEAVLIADRFIQELTWKLGSDTWIYNFYPRSNYFDWREGAASETSERRFHGINYHRAHEGIRYESNYLGITVDNVTGNVQSYSVFWQKANFESSANMISFDNAAKKMFNDVIPFLNWSDNTGTNKKLVYSLHDYYVMDAAGKFPASLNQETPPFTDKIKPHYQAQLAKLRLLSLYELDRSYIGDGTTNKPYYKLRIKPDVPVFSAFYNAVQPSIDANTGEWRDFLNEPVTAAFPPVGDWLIDTAVPARAVGYTAAVVWNHELLELANEPIIQNGYTMIPFRELLTKLGAKITWVPEKRLVRASKNDTVIELTIDSATVVINGKAQKLDTPARITGGRTYIPARLVLEAFGAQVTWNVDSRLVLVTTDKSLPQLTAKEMKQLRFKAHLNWLG